MSLFVVTDILRFIQEKRADYIPRMGRRSGSQDKEDKVEFYTPRMGRSFSGKTQIPNVNDFNLILIFC